MISLPYKQTNKKIIITRNFSKLYDIEMKFEKLKNN